MFISVCSVEAKSYVLKTIVGFFLLLLYFYSGEELWMSTDFETWIHNINKNERGHESGQYMHEITNIRGYKVPVYVTYTEQYTDI